MGVYDRDYFREDQTSSVVVDTPVVWLTVGVLAAAMLLLWTASSNKQLAELYQAGEFHREKVWEQREVWRLVSYAVLPNSPVEACVTLLAVLLVGRPFERKMGSWRTAAVMVGGALAASCSLLLFQFDEASGRSMQLLGPTPGLIALLTAALVRTPFADVVVYMPMRQTIELRGVALVFLVLAAASAVTLGWRSASLPACAAAGLAGLGVAYVEVWRGSGWPKRRMLFGRSTKLVDRLKRPRRQDQSDQSNQSRRSERADGRRLGKDYSDLQNDKTQMGINMQPSTTGDGELLDEDSNSRSVIDAILEKIAATGMDSLTEAERQSLVEESRRLREGRGG